MTESVTVDAWLAAARDVLAESADVPAEKLRLDDDTAATLLELARAAAHESGDRRNAPLLCYLAGLVADEIGVDDVLAAIRHAA